MLQVNEVDCMSVRLSLNETLAGDYRAIQCNSLLSSEERNHTLTIHLKEDDSSTLLNDTLEFKPLLPATQYVCCFENGIACSESFNTAQCRGSLSLVGAGAIGSVVAIVVTLLLTAGIAGIIFGTLVLTRRRKAIKRARNRPVLRTNSKIYKRGDQDQRSNMSPESIVEDTLKPLSLPTAKPRPQPPKKHPPYQAKGRQQEQNSKGKGPVEPPTNSHQGNYYSSQTKEPDPIESEYEDSFEDYDDFAEPEETYETMLSTADNVAYKNRSPAPRVQRKPRPKPPQHPPEEYYDYLPG